MARIAFIKLFTGLNLAVSQLAGELQRAGHEARIIYLKDYRAADRDDLRMPRTPYAGNIVAAKGKVRVWNCYTPISEREYELLFDVLREFQPDLIGLSLTSAGLDLAADVTKRVRDVLGVKVIWGGAGPTLEPERCLESADLVCINEGEEVIVELATRLDTGGDLTTVEGVWSKSGGAIKETPRRPTVELDSIAFPDFSRERTFHIENDKLTRNVLPHNLGDQYVIMTSRGCPFSCSFCVESVYQDMFGKKGSLRRRSVDLVIEELIRAKQERPVGSVMFYDDVFTTHRQWLREFAPRYAKDVGLPFWCYTYPTTTRKDDIELLRDAGCISMTIGIQSGSERILKEYFNRPTPLKRALESMQIIIDAGIECFFDLITQVEFETEDDLRATVDFLMEVPRGAKCVGFGHMVQFPTYGYTAQVATSGARHSVEPRVYDYYHNLYWVALSSLPYEQRRAISLDPTYRESPELLADLLPKQLPHAFIQPKAKPARSAEEFIDIGIAQATIQKQPAAEAEPSRDKGSVVRDVAEVLHRRLPIVSS